MAPLDHGYTRAFASSTTPSLSQRVFGRETGCWDEGSVPRFASLSVFTPISLTTSVPIRFTPLSTLPPQQIQLPNKLQPRRGHPLSNRMTKIRQARACAMSNSAPQQNRLCRWWRVGRGVGGKEGQAPRSLNGREPSKHGGPRGAEEDDAEWVPGQCQPRDPAFDRSRRVYRLQLYAVTVVAVAVGDGQGEGCVWTLAEISRWKVNRKGKERFERR
jgi:hypothetical protein